MKYFFLFLITLFILPSSLWAHKIRESAISGSVIDAQSGEPLVQATVRLLALPDSLLIKGTVSSSDGSFAMHVRKQGKCLVAVSYIGFDSYYKQIQLPADGGHLSLGTIRLGENAQLLGEALVEGKAPEVVLKEDTVEYNASSYKLPSNSMVEDLIKKLPGVEMDADGKLMAGGKEISKILVDGKEFFGKDITVALKNINVDILQKLQVIDRKSDEARLTGVDDGEEEKIINLTIKEGMKKGWFGNVSGAYGNKNRYEGYGIVNRFVGDNQYSVLGGVNNTNNSGFADAGNSMYSGSGIRSGERGGLTTSGNVGTNFNYEHKKKLNINGGVMMSGSNQNIDMTTWRENLLSNNSTYYDQRYSGFSQSRSLGLDMRMEWKIDSLTQLDFVPSLQLNTSKGHNESDFYTIRPDSIYINRGDDRKETDMNGINYSGRITLARSSARKKGRKTSLSFNWTGNVSSGTSFQSSHTLYGDDRDPKSAVRDTTVNQKQTEKESKQAYRIRLSYVEPFANKRFFQASYTLNCSYSTSNRYSYNRDEADEAYSQEFDSIYSDRFKNIFLSHSINLSVRTVRKKYNYMLGLTLDPSTTHSVNYFDPDRSFDRSVFNLGPNGEFVYLWSKYKNIRFQYRGRTQQPSINQLQPSKNITNPLIIREGNLDLSPSYLNNYSVRYHMYEPKTQRALQAVVQGRFVFNSIVNQSIYNEETGVQTIKPVNVNGVWSVEGYAMYNTPFRNKKFQFSNNINLSHNQQIGYTNGQKNKARTYNMHENFSFRYSSDLFDAGIRSNYSFSTTQNSIASKKDQRIMNYGGTFNLLFYLPLNITLGSDFSYRGNHGYVSSMVKNEWLWNVQANMEFLRNKQASLFIRAYDLLHQRSNLSRRVTANYIEDVQSNLLTDYFLIGFSYRFNTMGEGNKSNSSKERPKSGKGGKHSRSHSAAMKAW